MSARSEATAQCSAVRPSVASAWSSVAPRAIRNSMHCACFPTVSALPTTACMSGDRPPSSTKFTSKCDGVESMLWSVSRSPRRDAWSTLYWSCTSSFILGAKRGSARGGGGGGGTLDNATKTIRDFVLRSID